jgi:hypothetical protein
MGTAAYSGRVDAGRDEVAPTVGEFPHQNPGGGLGQTPALSLLSLMIPSAERREVAFASAAALVVGQGMVVVAALRRTVAVGSRAGALPGLHDVMQGLGYPVTRDFASMTAAPGLHRTRTQPG